MVTAEEIRARVEATDRARIQARADAAAQIAADVERRRTVVAELAEIDASLTARIDAAAAVMTLAEFTGIPETELRAVGNRTGESRSRRTRRATSVRGKSTTRAARSRRGAVAPVPADSDTDPVVVYADVPAGPG